MYICINDRDIDVELTGRPLQTVYKYKIDILLIRKLRHRDYIFCLKPNKLWGAYLNIKSYF